MSERSQEWDLRSEEASLARGFVEPVSYFSPKLNLEYYTICFGYLNWTARFKLTAESNTV